MKMTTGLYMRILHRYLGFFFAGVMAGIVFAFARSLQRFAALVERRVDRLCIGGRTGAFA